MYLTCIRKEILANILSLRYAVISLLFVGAIVSATVVRAHIYKKQVADYHHAVAERKASMRMARRFWQSRGLGITVEKAPNPMAVFAYGLEEEMVRSFSLSDWFPPAVGGRKLSNPVFRYFLRLDLVLVVNIVCSLLALLLVYDSICGERERGTLKVLLSGPVPRDVLIVSKMFAGLATLLAPFLISVVMALLYTIYIARIPFTRAHATHLGTILVLSVVYLSFFFALGTAISAWSRRSATSLVVALFIWVIFVLGVPNLVPMIVKHVAPIPPQSKIVKEKQAIREYVEKNLEPKWHQELLATGKYPLWGDRRAMVRMKAEVEIGRRELKIDHFHNRRIEQQATLAQNVSRISPSAGFLFAATEFAGTGVRAYLRLLSSVDVFQREFLKAQREQEKKRIEATVARREAGLPEPKEDEIRDAYDPEAWPPFKTDEPSFARALNFAAIDVVVLIAFSVICFLAGFVGFLRYDPR